MPAPNRSNLQRTLPVFSAAGRVWTLGAVTEWARLQDASPSASAQALACSDTELEQAARAWRYQRQLISAEDCTAWLAARGLDYADLLRWLRARGSTAATSERLATLEFLLNGGLEDSARALAWRVAQCVESEGEDYGNQALEAGFEAACQQLLKPSSRTRMLGAMQDSLTRIEFELAEFDLLDAAREACCCLHDQPGSLCALAEEHGLVSEHRSCRYGELPERWARRLRTAATGRPITPFEDGGRFLVLLPIRRQPAQLDEAEVATAVDDRLCRSHFDALSARHIHWLMPLHLVVAEPATGAPR